MLLSCFTIAVSATGAAAHTPHFKGCNTAACDLRVSYPKQPTIAPRASPAHSSTTSSTAWAWTYTAFDDCVVFKESGRVWNASNGVDVSYYQWLPATWQGAQRDVGVSFTSDPLAATLAQQTYVFNLWEPTNGHRSDWPQTVPACGG